MKDARHMVHMLTIYTFCLCLHLGQSWKLHLNTFFFSSGSSKLSSFELLSLILTHILSFPVSAEECLCQNGGVCVDINGTCECPSGYTGLYCQFGGYDTHSPIRCLTRALMNVKKVENSKITNVSSQKPIFQKFVNLSHIPFLPEVTQTPCSNSRPCPDGGPCLEYGGTYLCTCQTSGAELDHKDFYPYGKSLRHQPNNRALCSYVSLHEQLVTIATNTFLNTLVSFST